jgi:hypothetical protein
MTTTDTPTEDGPRVRPFAEFLQQQRRGALHGELSEQLHELLQAVKETGKAGALTVRIDIKPAAKGNAEQVVVSDTSSVKKPQAARPESVFFLDDDGNLSRSDPRQTELPLREVNRPAATDAKAVNR